MLLRIIGGYGGELPGCRSTCFLVNESVALDAGSLSSGLGIEEQLRVRHILLSHSHADHCASLTYLSENIFGHVPAPLEIHCSTEVLDALRAHLLNDVIWPDMFALKVFEAKAVRAWETFDVAGMQVTAIPLPHTVPCMGFYLDDGDHGLLYSADMGPCKELWSFANSVERLDTVLVECSFPNRLRKLAQLSQHLCPSELGAQLERLDRPVDVLVYHIKPPHLDEVAEELAALGIPSMHIVEQDRRYEIGLRRQDPVGSCNRTKC